MGTRKIVAAQLRLRFGELPPAVIDRLTQADQEQLMSWAGDLLTATPLDELFSSDS